MVIWLIVTLIKKSPFFHILATIFHQFKKNYWSLQEACNFTKINTPPWVFFTFFNCTNGTKSRNASYITLELTWRYLKLKKFMLTDFYIVVFTHDNILYLEFIRCMFCSELWETLNLMKSIFDVCSSMYIYNGLILWFFPSILNCLLLILVNGASKSSPNQ